VQFESLRTLRNRMLRRTFGYMKKEVRRLVKNYEINTRYVERIERREK
jgi:hypothetical protein